MRPALGLPKESSNWRKANSSSVTYEPVFKDQAGSGPDLSPEFPQAADCSGACRRLPRSTLAFPLSVGASTLLESSPLSTSFFIVARPEGVATQTNQPCGWRLAVPACAFPAFRFSAGASTLLESSPLSTTDFQRRGLERHGDCGSPSCDLGTCRSGFRRFGFPSCGGGRYFTRTEDSVKDFFRRPGRRRAVRGPSRYRRCHSLEWWSPGSRLPEEKEQLVRSDGLGASCSVTAEPRRRREAHIRGLAGSVKGR